jgi:hypothetical protein
MNEEEKQKPSVSVLGDEPTADSILYVPFMIGKLSSAFEGLSKRLDDGFHRNDDAQAATNQHLKDLNGSVARHEKQLGDQERFRDAVNSEAKAKAEAAAAIKARRVGAYWAIMVSIATFIVIGLIAYLAFRYLHINLRTVG